MSGISSGINLWVRANMEQYSEDTEALIEPERKELYRELMGDLLVAGALLNDSMSDPMARKRYVAAQLARDAFMEVYLT